MTTSANDISIVLSGGTSNILPNFSLGGDPSSSPIPSGVLNNIFDDVSSSQALNGSEEYRCIYIFNDGDTTIWSIKISINNSATGGSTMQLGLSENNESQRISIVGTMTGGQLVIAYKDRTITLPYNSDLGTMAINLQTELQNLTISNVSEEKFFKQLTVTAQVAANNTVIFDIRWSGKDSKRNFDKLELATNGNQLTPLGNVSVNFSVNREGSPINTIAGNISVENNPPGGVNFYEASSTVPITLPFLSPNEGFPLWIKRIVPAGSTSLENDGFTLRFSAESLEPYN